MNCPSCKHGVLKPTKIVAGLPALSCGSCGGYLLSMLSYRVWVENNPQLADMDVEIEALNETSKPIICPKCQKLMTKYRISSETQNKLDSCGNCGELWIDNGEWKLLFSLGVAGKLSSVLSQSWQLEIRNQDNEAAYESRYEQLLGSDEYAKLRQFRGWANKHQHKLEIKNYVARI